MQWNFIVSVRIQHISWYGNLIVFVIFLKYLTFIQFSANFILKRCQCAPWFSSQVQNVAHIKVRDSFGIHPLWRVVFPPCNALVPKWVKKGQWQTKKRVKTQFCVEHNSEKPNDKEKRPNLTLKALHCSRKTNAIQRRYINQGQLGKKIQYSLTQKGPSNSKYWMN